MAYTSEGLGYILFRDPMLLSLLQGIGKQNVFIWVDRASSFSLTAVSIALTEPRTRTFGSNNDFLEYVSVKWIKYSRKQFNTYIVHSRVQNALLRIVSSLLVFDFRPLVGDANSAHIKLVLRMLVGVLCYVLIVLGVG